MTRSLPELHYDTNILYAFNPLTGQATGASNTTSFQGALTDPFEVGQINTDAPVPADSFRSQLGITNATEIGPDGVARPSLVDGDSFILSNGIDTVTFELDQSFTLVAGAKMTLSEIVDGLSARQTITLSGETLLQGVPTVQQATFEFVTFGQVAPGNIAVSLVDAQGVDRAAEAIARDLAAAINANVAGLGAQSQGAEIVFSFTPLSLTANGAGVEVFGRPVSDGDAVSIDGRIFEFDTGDGLLRNPDATKVAVSNVTDPEAIIRSLVAAIRGAGIRVSAAGTQLSLPDASSATLQPNSAVAGFPLELSGVTRRDGRQHRHCVVPHRYGVCDRGTNCDPVQWRSRPRQQSAPRCDCGSPGSVA